MKPFKILPVLSPLVLLTGCTFGASIDALMTPPKLSVEQEQIYNALTDAAGTSISLKYPKSGKYLSAFIVEDIDGDGGNEAVVFYEKSSLAVEENTLRINILDRDGDKWRSVCDTPAEGAEIEKVMISRLGNNSRVNLIIGSSLINRSEKNVSMYEYSDGMIEQTFSSSYSFFDVTDLDNDSESEFFLLSGSAAGAPAQAEAYRLDESGIYHKYSRELSGSFTEFDNIRYGTVGGGKTGLYIDAVSGTGFIQTDIVYMDSSGLNKIFQTADDSLATVRPSGCSSFDVDSDGFPEIPVQTIAHGYEDVSEGEQMKLTQWLCLNEENQLEKKYTSYYSITDGYIFIFPEKWQDKATVKRDVINDEIVFCEYADGKTGRELLRICCTKDAPSREDRISSGYMLLRTKGESAYLAYIPKHASDETDSLAISTGDVSVGIRFPT